MSPQQTDALDEQREAELKQVLLVGARNRVRPLPPGSAFEVHRTALNRTIDRLGDTPEPAEALRVALRAVKRQVTSGIHHLSVREIKNALLWYSVLEARYQLSDAEGREEIATGIDGRYARALRRVVELACAHGSPGKGLGAERVALLWVRLAFLELLLLDTERIERHGDKAVLTRDSRGWVLSVSRDVREAQAEIRTDEAQSGSDYHGAFVSMILDHQPVLDELSGTAGFSWQEAAGFFLDCEQLALDRGGLVGVPDAEFMRVLATHGIVDQAADAFVAAFVMGPAPEADLPLSNLHRFRQHGTMALTPYARIGDEILWSFGPIVPALCANTEYAVAGKHPRWTKLGPRAGALVNARATEFEAQVVEVLGALPGVSVRSALKKPLGDTPAPPREIDALCWIDDPGHLLIVEAKNFHGLPDLAGWRQARSRTQQAERQLDDQVRWATRYAGALARDVFGAETVGRPPVVGLVVMPSKVFITRWTVSRPAAGPSCRSANSRYLAYLGGWPALTTVRFSDQTGCLAGADPSGPALCGADAHAFVQVGSHDASAA